MIFVCISPKPCCLGEKCRKTCPKKGWLETGSVFGKALCSDEGTCWLIDAPEAGWQGMELWLLQATPSTRDRAQNRWAGFFTPNGKLWLLSSILDMETYVRTHKLITMKQTWSFVHKYSLVSAFSTFSFTEEHETDSLLMQTNKGLDSSRLDAVWPSINIQGSLLILALPFVCG